METLQTFLSPCFPAAFSLLPPELTLKGPPLKYRPWTQYCNHLSPGQVASVPSRSLTGSGRKPTCRWAGGQRSDVHDCGILQRN